MAGYKDSKELLKRINLLRRKLEEHLSMTDKPTEEEVVKISQKLDELIVAYYNLKGNLGDK